jgi:hypothetical protein
MKRGVEVVVIEWEDGEKVSCCTVSVIVLVIVLMGLVSGWVGVGGRR